MRIVHIGKYYPPFHGGMENYLDDLAQQQAKTNDVVVLVHNHRFKFLTSKLVNETINNVKVIRLKTLKPLLFTPLMLGLNKTFNKIQQQATADVIHISWPNPSALFLLLNKSAKKIPWVIQWQSDMVTEHSSWLLKVAYFFFKPLEKMLLKRAQVVIASTKEYVQHSNILPKYKNKCRIVPLGQKKLMPSFTQEDSDWAQNLWQNAAIKIYHIGRLTFYKNQKLLLQAAQLLPDVRFIITGSGDLQTQLETQIKKDKLKNIRLTGPLEYNKLHALLASCDAFCLPSNDRAESYGMVLLEALSFGKNILVSDLPGSGMRWIASTTPLGQTFDCNNAADLVAKIKQLNLSQNNTSLPKCFTIEECANAIDAIYKKL